MRSVDIDLDDPVIRGDRRQPRHLMRTVATGLAVAACPRWRSRRAQPHPGSAAARCSRRRIPGTGTCPAPRWTRARRLHPLDHVRRQVFARRLRRWRRVRDPVPCRAADAAARDTRFVDYADESDPGPYPIPLNAPERGSDRHVLVLQRGTYACSRCSTPGARAPVGRPPTGRCSTCAQPPAHRGPHVGRRRRPADPPRPGPLRRGALRRRQPRPALHGVAHPARLHSPGHALRRQLDRPRPAAHGPAPASGRATRSRASAGSPA